MKDWTTNESLTKNGATANKTKKTDNPFFNIQYCKFGFYSSFFERDVTRKRMKDVKKFLSAFISIKQKQKSVKIRSQCQSQRTDKKLNKVNGLTKAEQSQWFDNDLTNS